MQMLGVYLLILASCAIYSSAQSTMILGGTIRDQAPNTMLLCGKAGTANNSAGFWGTDFEIPLGSYTEHEYGLVGKECNATYGFYPPACGQLGTDLTPVYAYTGTSPGNNIKSPATFYNWFHSTAQNIPIAYNITLSLVAGTASTYSYINDNFFPITGQGWKDSCPDANNDEENFSFCLEAHTRFGYSGNEVFNFAGDDDVWVFIDGRLVIDLGSLHSKTSRSLKVDTIEGLTPGNNYRFDFFYCERHTVESHMEVTTSIQFFCAYYDWCGICEGTGQSCCNSSVLNTVCNDNNACTTDSCPVLASPYVNASACVHTPITCPVNSNICFPSLCDPALGCTNTTLNCDDGDECTIDSCNPASGCAHHSCNGTALCPAGCTTRPYCDDGNPCTSDDITVVNGVQNCTNVLNGSICDDSNVCTNDYCDSSYNTTTLACKHTNVTCTPTLCQVANGCDKVKGCQFAPVACPGSNDYCQVTSCDPVAGCISAPRTCVVSDPYCFKGVCSNVSQSCTQQRVSNFNVQTNKNGILCALVYDSTVKKAAIGTGAAVGIAIGAAAAMGIFGYGGKKGYDYIQTMRNQKFDGVQNNPLYEQTNANSDNPLYRYSTSNPTA